MNTPATDTKAKPTAGPVEAKGIYIMQGKNFLGQSIGLGDENVCNVQLWAEGHNVYHETGLTPRELVEQRDRLLNLVKKIEASLMTPDYIKGLCQKEIKATE